jgi:type I restriction enzyme S subunit
LAPPSRPLEEQQRIVALLDEAFEGLARARAHAEANLQNARELFDRSVDACFVEAGENAAGATTLGEIASFRNGLNFTRSSQGAAVKIVGVGDFKDNFAVPLEALSSVKIEGALATEDRLQKGDFLAVRSNGNKALIGRTMLVPALIEPVVFSGFTIRIRLHTDSILPEFLCEQMKTKAVRALLMEGGGGANISNLNQRLLSGLPIQVPGIAAQSDLLDRLATLGGEVEAIEQLYRAKLHDLDDLRQSLLQKAFAGELT